MSTYTFRIVTTPGIEKVLIKELKLLGIKNVQKVNGRKVVEAKGTLKDLYKMVYKWRIAENIQIKPWYQFLARGEKELEKNLNKVPWHAYMPLENFQDYKFPIVIGKSFKSELYHTKKISDIVKLYLNELPIKREFSKFNR